MGRTGTVTILFTDIVGSTALLDRLGERDFDEMRRAHFGALRSALADHDGTEVKNTGDGVMAAFPSTVDAVHCALAMVQGARHVRARGSAVAIRVGLATGEAVSEHGDWFGTPVVTAARLCAIAGTDEIWANDLVSVLAGSQAEAAFEPLGPHALKGFDQPVPVVRVRPATAPYRSMFADIDRHTERGDALVAQLDFWETLPSLQRMKADVVGALAPVPGDVVVDIGCGTGSELVRFGRLVGPTGRVIGVDPSPTMVEQSRTRCAAAGVAAELIQRDGRDTGLPGASCDAVRIERVIQHTGDLAGFLAEAMRITKPGGRIAVADSDWGSLIIHPGDREQVRRFKSWFEQGPIPEPWAGRTLHAGLVASGLTDVSSRAHAITADGDLTQVLRPMLDRFVEGRAFTRHEADDLLDQLDRASEAGGLVYAFTMFVAAGRRP